MEPQSPCGSKLESQLADVLACARAPSTTVQYKGAWAKWKEWTLANKVNYLPAEPKQVALYLVHVGNSALSFSSIKLVYSSISWGHNQAGMVSPTLSPLVVEAIAGLKRLLAKPTIKKEPFQVIDMQKLQGLLVHSCLTDLRNTAMIITAFFGFLRFDELIRITGSDVVMFESHVELSIARSKCDQLRQGSLVVISRLDKFCPVALLDKYLKAAGDRITPNAFIFRRVEFHKGIKSLSKSNIALSYSNVRDVVKAKAVQLGLDPSFYGTHSMRAGGSTAAANSGVEDRLFQRHGRWSSVTSKNGYIKDCLASRLSVTKALV